MRKLGLRRPGLPVKVNQSGQDCLCTAWVAPSCCNTPTCCCVPEVTGYSVDVVCKSRPNGSFVRTVDYQPASSVTVALIGSLSKGNDTSACQVNHTTELHIIHTIQSGLFIEKDAQISCPGGMNIRLSVVCCVPGNCVVKGTRRTSVLFARAPTKVPAGVPFRSSKESGAGSKLRRAVLLPHAYREQCLSLDKASGRTILGFSGILVYGSHGVGKSYAIHQTLSELRALVNTRVFRVCYSDEGLQEAFEQAFAGAKEFVCSVETAVAVVIVEDLDRICSKRGDGTIVQVALIAQLLTFMDGVRGSQRIVLIASAVNPNALDPALRRPGRFDYEVDMQAPLAAERAEILRNLLKESHMISSEEILDLARKTAGFLPADLKALVQIAEAAVNTAQLVECCVYERLVSVVKTMEVTSSVQRRRRGAIRASASWDDIGGYDNVKRVLKQALEWPLKHESAIKRFGLRPMRGILLHGPPGCCKTTFARVAASSSGCAFISLSGADIYSAFVGESERILRQAFADARSSAPCVLFFDEFEAVVRARSFKTGADGGRLSVGQSRVLSTFLNEMDGIESASGVLVLAATNRLDQIDRALLRPGRFDRVLLVPLPDADSRSKIFGIHLRSIPTSGQIDTRLLAEISQGLSGAEIANICREASMAAFRNGDSQVDAVALQKAIRSH